MGPTNTAIPSEYVDREQALIKHELLRAYLEKLVLIVGSSARRVGVTEVCYVDCFAGPWDVEGDSLASTSIAISLNILARCYAQLSRNQADIRIRALFVEKNDRAFKRLSDYLAGHTPAGIQAEALHGDFSELRGEILSWCGGTAFAFFFVDPTGWRTVAIDQLRPLLSRPKSELLITFVYDWINRTASMPSWQQAVQELLGEQVELGGLSPSQREDRILSTYRRNTKAAMRPTGDMSPRSAYVRVLDPAKQRPKYHLVYLTRHPRGLIEFMKISQGVEIIQRKVRAVTQDRKRAQRTGMNDMFGVESAMDGQQDRVSPEDVDRFWLDQLGQSGRQIGEAEFADMLEQTGWFPDDLQSSLVRLIDQQQVRNRDARRRRPKQPLHWQGRGEYLERTEGRR